MNLITDLKEANDLLKQYSKATVQIWTFHISHKKLAIRLSYLNTLEVLYILIMGCEHISGPFSWNNPNISIVKTIDDITSEPIYKISDKIVGFELISAGGFSLAQGLEADFGEPFENFFKDKK